MPFSCRQFLAVLMVAALLPLRASAQDLEPRRWTHLPIGSSTIGIGYAGQEATIYFNPAIGITDGTANINAWLARYSHAFGLADKTARVDLMMPYVSGDWRGIVGTAPGRRQINAGGDPWLRFSVNLIGAPALKGEAYRAYLASNSVRTTLGLSLAVSMPWGAYDPDELINIGRNRYAFRPQLGLLHQRGPWSLELTGSLFVFTDNSEFLETSTLAQDPVAAIQGHVSYSFPSGLWLGTGLAYAKGGEIDLDGLRTRYEVDNVLWNAITGYRVTARQSIVVAWQQGRTQVDAGSDTDSWVLSWVYGWGR